MNGWRFREEQQRLADPQLSETPVVILSALAECHQHARALGAVAVIPKPANFERLLTLVQQFLL